MIDFLEKNKSPQWLKDLKRAIVIYRNNVLPSIHKGENSSATENLESATEKFDQGSNSCPQKDKKLYFSNSILKINKLLKFILSKKNPLTYKKMLLNIEMRINTLEMAIDNLLTQNYDI
jgi:hypothetical protein